MTDEWSQPAPGNYPGTVEITRDGKWCSECNRKHVERITRRNGQYAASIGPHWVGHFGSADDAMAALHEVAKERAA